MSADPGMVQGRNSVLSNFLWVGISVGTFATGYVFSAKRYEKPSPTATSRSVVPTTVQATVAPHHPNIAGATIAPEAIESPIPPTPSEVDRFFDRPDAPIVSALRSARIRRVERGHGGRSLSFKITLEDGTQGYFKPEQSFSAAHYYSELAAYYLDRELGLGRVAPTVGRVFSWSQLERAAGDDARVNEIARDAEGRVRGAFIWWVPERLVALNPGRGFDRWFRIEAPLFISPYQRATSYIQIAGGHPLSGDGEGNEGDRVERAMEPAGNPDREDRPAELSDMILFDFLTENIDRWGGGFTNVRTLGAHGPLMYLDNGAGFTNGRRPIGFMLKRLTSLQRFRRSTVDSIRAFSLEHYRERLASDPLAQEGRPLLSDSKLAQMEERRRVLLEHVAAMEARFGDRIWLPETASAE